MNTLYYQTAAPVESKPIEGWLTKEGIANFLT